MKFTYYEALGYLIHAEENMNHQLEMIKETLGPMLYEFQQFYNIAQENPAIMKEEEIQKKLVFFLKVNEMLAKSIGQEYIVFLEIIAEQINKLYLFFSAEIETTVKNNGKNYLNYMSVKLMRAVKKEAIKIYIRFIENCDHLDSAKAEYILNKIIFPLGDLLEDFKHCMS